MPRARLLVRNDMLREKIHRIFRFDLKYFLTGGLKLGVGQAVNVVLSFVLSLILVNALSKELYGQYKYALTILSLLALTGLTEMMTAVIRGVARGYDGSILKGFRVKLAWGFLGTVIGFGVAGYYLAHHQDVLGWAILAGSIVIPVTNALYLYEAYFQGKKQFGRSVLTSVVVQFAYTLGVAIAVLVSKNIAVILVLGYGAMLVARALYLRSILRMIPANSPSDPELMRLGTHLSAIKMMSFVASSIWNIALFHYFGSVSLALYAVASAPIEQIRGFLLIGENLLLPKVSDPQWRMADPKTFLRKLVPVLVLVFVGIVCFQLLSPWFYRLFFPAYLDAVPYSNLLAWSLIFTSIQIVATTILRARQALRELHLLNIVEILASTVLALPMIFFYQITGLIISILIMKCLSVGFGLFFLFRSKGTMTSGGETAAQSSQEPVGDLS